MITYLDARWVRACLPRRQPDAHKGRFGRLLLLCGSSHYRGAATLAAGGALRCGTGLVQLASIEAVCAAAAACLPCCTFWPMPQALDGGMGPEGLEGALGTCPTAILAGCGLGNTAGTARLMHALLSAAVCPLVLDADALNALAGYVETGLGTAPGERLDGFLNPAARPVIITPHPGEMARLCGDTPEAVVQNQPAVAAAYARRHGCVVVLKSHITVVAQPDGLLYINNKAGNAGLAKGGSGDVLAGIIAGLLAQGLPAGHAAAAGVWLHAAAADTAAKRAGLAALSPADLPQALAVVLQTLGF